MAAEGEEELNMEEGMEGFEEGMEEGAEGLEEGLDGLDGGGDLEGLEEGEDGLNELDAALADDPAIDQLTAALAEEPVVEEEVPVEEEESEDEEEEKVEEHLKDAVEGSLRLKRMLSEDGNTATGGAKKKRKKDFGIDPVIEAKVKQLLMKWRATTDAVMKHVLDQCTIEELKYLESSNYQPNRMDHRKTAPELLAQSLIHLKEKKLGGGSRIDVISAFKLRWSLGMEAEKLLRGLQHKELRYVINTYDGSSTLEDVISEAATAEDDDYEDNTLSACPTRPGVKTMSRFNRLELIDPLADCAVFGDANLTFSLNLAAHRKAFGHVGRVIATTFEEVDTLRERYKEIDHSIKILEDHHAEVYHGVDCTRVALDPRFEGMEGKLGAVYYNYPHSGAIQGFFDSNPMVNWRHENLMRLFFRALRSFMKPGGIVKVASNSGAVGVRYSYIVGSAIENEFLHVETMPFLEWHLHRYGRSYGDRRDVYKRPDAKNNQSYNAQNANSDMVYCFCYAPTGATLPSQPIRLPPSLKTLSQCPDGPFKNMPPGTPARAKLAKQLHQRFATEVSGVHVG